jgi:RES domain-containing protein
MCMVTCEDVLHGSAQSSRRVAQQSTAVALVLLVTESSQSNARAVYPLHNPDYWGCTAALLA